MGKQSREKKERREVERRQNSPTSSQQPAQPPVYVTTIEGVSYRGPLPPPQILQGYEELLPGAAERIFAMAEENQKHRHKLESEVIPRKSRNETRGQFFGFILAIVTIGIGAFLIYLDKNVIGLSVILTELVLLVTLFIYTDQQKRKELGRKKPRG
jgi:uncharacterized membrane protein